MLCQLDTWLDSLAGRVITAQVLGTHFAWEVFLREAMLEGPPVQSGCVRCVEIMRGGPSVLGVVLRDHMANVDWECVG